MHDLTRIAVLVLCTLACLPTVLVAHAETLSVEQQLVLAGNVSPSLVVVEYWLQYDRLGDAPGSSFAEGRGTVFYRNSAGEYGQSLTDRQPYEIAGYMVGPRKVVIADPIIEARFVRQITVRRAGDSVRASVVSVASEQAALMLELEGDLEGARPLEFTGDPGDSPQRLQFGVVNEDWTLSVFEFLPIIAHEPGQNPFIWIHPGLFVDRNGQALGITFTNQAAPVDRWVGSPLEWDWIPIADAEAALADAEEALRQRVLRTSIVLRSPEAPEESDIFGSTMIRFSDSFGNDSNPITEAHAVAIVVGESRAIVLVDLDSEATARIDRIRLYDGEGKPIDAHFVASLGDFGAMIVDLERPVATWASLSERTFREVKYHLKIGVDAAVAGEELILRAAYDRIGIARRGFRNWYYPTTMGQHSLVFDRDMSLASLPLSRRAHPSEQSQWNSSETLVLGSQYLRDILNDLDSYADPANVPKSDSESKAIAWLGVVLQPVDSELARASGIAELTSDGSYGAMVTYVYPGSPAHQAGIQTGAVLLRLRIDGDPIPVPIRLEQEAMSNYIPAELLDQLPEEFAGELPPPWPSAKNEFTELLTRIGIGKACSLDLIQDGELIAVPQIVAQGPVHYEAAPRFKSDRLGVTVRNLTFEVRRHLRMSDDDPGVVVSKIEPGGKAFIAGIRPYEIVTHLNGEPLPSIDRFEQETSDPGAVQMAIRRMDRTRQVRINR